MTLTRFTPPSLLHLEQPPKFQLRESGSVSPADYQAGLEAEGLIFHDPATFRAEMLKAGATLWSAHDFAEASARLEAHWRRLDRGAAPAAEDESAVAELMSRLLRWWPPLKEMAADNLAYQKNALPVALQIMLRGWEYLALPYSLSAGRLPLELIAAIGKRLSDIEAAAALPKPGTAFGQLLAEAFNRIHHPTLQKETTP